MFSLTNLHSSNIMITLSVLLSGYEGVPEFFNDLLNHIISVLQDHSSNDPSAPPPPSQLLALGAGERNCAPSQECCGMLGKESDSSPWIVEGDSGLKGPCQRLGCNSAMSPNFQQHCVSTIATKASSQWLPSPYCPTPPPSFPEQIVKTEWIIYNNNNNYYTDKIYL